MQFLQKIVQNNRFVPPHLGLAPPSEILDPPLIIIIVITICFIRNGRKELLSFVLMRDDLETNEVRLLLRSLNKPQLE